MKLDIKKLYENARLALWRRREYRSVLDIPKDFILRSTSEWFAGRRPPITFQLALGIRQLPGKIHLRVGDSDFLVLDEIFFQSEYERVKQWDLAPDARIVDLGANVGLASLYFASLYPQSQLVAVEPGEANCQLIERNGHQLCEANRLHVYRAFAAAKDGTAGLDDGWRAWAFQKVDKVDDKHRAVRCLSIPTLLNDCKFDRVDLLKCDIEGSERELFRDCAAWIGKIRHLIVETHNPYSGDGVPYSVKDLYRDLTAAGWKFEVTYEKQERLIGIAFLKGLSCA